jgi:hypothetical protein
MRQFSIRDLLFLVAIVALALGWWFDRRPVPARFQMTTTAGHAFVLDTATGQVWSRRVDPGTYISSSGGFHAAKLPE